MKELDKLVKTKTFEKVYKKLYFPSVKNLKTDGKIYRSPGETRAELRKRKSKLRYESLSARELASLCDVQARRQHFCSSL